MNKKQTTWLAFSLLLLGQATCGIPITLAGFDLKDTVDTKASPGEGNFGRQKLTLISDVRFGYDDNPLARSDSFHSGNQLINQDTGGSAFINGDVGVTYTAANPRFTLSIGADVGASYYFDREGRDYDVNGGFTLRSTYKATPRLFIEVSSYNSYVSQGDYGASNLSGFNNGIATGGQTGQTTADRDGDYFYTSNAVSGTYQVNQRISLVTSGNLIAFAYVDDYYSMIQDRIEYYFSEQFRYLVQPQLTLTAQYRFGYVDYFSVSNDSYNHFALGGVDYVFNPRLKTSVSVGAQFRTYVDAPSSSDQTSPYAEASISYDLSRVSHLTFIGRYGIEEGDLTSDATNADTVRLGINYDRRITARISAYGGFYYTHSYYSTAVRNNPGTPGNFNDNTYDVSLGARYAINRHFAVEAGYTHTTVTSGFEGRDYDRNRYFGGLRFQF